MDRAQTADCAERRLMSMIYGARRRFPGVPIVFIPENAPGDMGAQYERMVRNEMPIITMREYGTAGHKHPMLGVPRDVDADMYARGEMVRRMKNGNVVFSDRFFTLDDADQFTTGASELTRAAKEQLEHQMRMYKGCAKVRKNDYENNDVIIATLLTFYWGFHKFFTTPTPAYAEFAQRYIGRTPVIVAD